MNSYMPSVGSTATSVDMSTAPTPLLTDMCELTMLQGALVSGAASRRSVFELFGHELPRSRRFGVVADTGRLLDATEAFTFIPAQIGFLHRTGVVNDEALDFLRDCRFSGAIRGYAKGECYFAGSPLLTVGDTLAEAYILETLALSIYNYDCAVATAASRITTTAHGHSCADFGTRRAREQTAVATTRASIVGGFVGTSNLEAGFLYGIPTVGTLAHSFTLLHDIEEEAFTAQMASPGPNIAILVDTYDIAIGVEWAIKTARAAGGELGAVHLDSGGLVAEASKVRAQLDALGAISTRITITNGLDEHTITVLGATPVDSHSMGIKLIMGSGCPIAALVCRLVECEGADGTMEEIAKFSSGGRLTVSSRRWAGRILNSEGTTAGELVVVPNSQDKGMSALGQAGARPLQVLLIDEDRIIEGHRGKEALSAAAERHWASRAELPYGAWRLSDGESALPTRHVDLDGRGATRR